jgi:hypothetical protein
LWNRGQAYVVRLVLLPFVCQVKDLPQGCICREWNREGNTDTDTWSYLSFLEFQRHFKYPVQMCELCIVPVPGTLKQKILHLGGFFVSGCHWNSTYVLLAPTCPEFFSGRFLSGPVLSDPVIRLANDGRVEGFRAHSALTPRGVSSFF